GLTSVATDAYPTLTIRTEDKNEYRYSKDVLGSFGANCPNTEWTCLDLDNNLGTVDWRTSSPSIAINPVSGDPWVAYHDSTNDDLKVAIYVGSGGDGCLTEMWDCTTIDSSGDVGKLSSIAFDSTGTAWVAYRNVSNGDL